MNTVAMRSVCNTATPRLVLEVTKKVRTGLRTESGIEFREGLAIHRG
jgi:hypothetical protein